MAFYITLAGLCYVISAAAGSSSSSIKVDEFAYVPKKRTHASEEQQAQRERLVEFVKVDEDVRCDHERLSRGKVQGVVKCRMACAENPDCYFYAFWPQKKYCETYHKCVRRIRGEKGLNTVLYRRLSECENMFNTYTTNIANAFPGNSARVAGNNPNMHCRCVTEHWMLCTIFVVPGSSAETIVKKKLNRDDPQGMLPFRVMQSRADQPNAPITFDIDGCDVYTEMEISYPNRCLPLNICVDGTPNAVCPVTKIPFDSGDPIYILDQTIPTLAEGHPVPCVSVCGLRTLSMINKGTGFQDPFHRRVDEMLLCRRDYTMMWVFEEKDMGVCQQMKKPSKKKKKKGAVSGEEGSSGPDFSSEGSPHPDSVAPPVKAPDTSPPPTSSPLVLTQIQGSAEASGSGALGPLHYSRPGLDSLRREIPGALSPQILSSPGTPSASDSESQSREQPGIIAMPASERLSLPSERGAASRSLSPVREMPSPIKQRQQEGEEGQKQDTQSDVIPVTRSRRKGSIRAPQSDRSDSLSPVPRSFESRPNDHSWRKHVGPGSSSSATRSLSPASMPEHPLSPTDRDPPISAQSAPVSPKISRLMLDEQAEKKSPSQGSSDTIVSADADGMAQGGSLQLEGNAEKLTPLELMKLETLPESPSVNRARIPRATKSSEPLPVPDQPRPSSQEASRLSEPDSPGRDLPPPKNYVSKEPPKEERLQSSFASKNIFPSLLLIVPLFCFYLKFIDRSSSHLKDVYIEFPS